MSKTSKKKTAATGTKLHRLAAPGAGYAWGASAGHIDMATPPVKPKPLTIAAAPQTVTIDLKRSAMIVIDMQNDFCTKGGWVDHIGGDYRRSDALRVGKACVRTCRSRWSPCPKKKNKQ